MAKTLDQFWEELRVRVLQLILQTLRKEGVYTADAFPDGRIASVSADGKRAEVYINASTTTITGVPVAAHVGTLTAGDEVVILQRSPRDLMVIAKKSI